MTDADTSSRPLRIALLGNVDPAIFWSTEWEYADAYSRLGHDVRGFQEQIPDHWDDLIHQVEDFDFVHWTSTHDFAVRAGDARQWELAAACRRNNVPLIGVHLDTWINLEREHRVHEVPYFRAVDVFFSADGDADELWEREGVNHRWLLPAISERWLGLGEPDPKYDCDVVFVGGWANYGHRVWTHRHELIRHLSKWYGDRFLALPRRGQPRIVGDELNKVYASAKVVVGDSCLMPHPDGRPKRNYCSDRIPETLGRGGILVHPLVENVTQQFGHQSWVLGDWRALKDRVDGLLAFDAESEAELRDANIDVTTEYHTYTRRAQEIIDNLYAEGGLP